jgi:alpha-amylase
MNYKLLLIFILSFGLASCQNYQRNKTDLQTWQNTAIIYEILPFQYPDNGGFKSIIKQRQHLRKLFINTISLLPITLAEGTEKVTVSNPYKVKDYKKIDPKLGTEKEFEGLLDSFHAIKIKCLLEFDFSQTAFDHPWLKEHNDFYINNSNDTSSSKFLLDISNTSLQKEILAILTYWLKEYNIDGLILRGLDKANKDFISTIYDLAVEKNNAILIIDASKEQLNNTSKPIGLLNKNLYSTLRKTIQDTFVMEDFMNIFNKDKSGSTNQYFVNYTHGVNAEIYIGSMQQIFDSQNKLVAAISNYANGVPLVFNGQDCPLFEKIDFKNKTPLNLKYQFNLDFYRSLFLHRYYNEALQVKSGESIENISNSKCIIAIKRKFGNQTTILMANLCSTTENYTLNEELGVVSELFTHAKLEFKSNKTYPLNGYQYIVVTNKY